MEIKTLQYGEVDAKEYVPGAEILLEENEEEVKKLTAPKSARS